jgi:hypothetical protein
MFTLQAKDVGTGGDYTTWAAFNAAIPADISTATGTDEIWQGNGLSEDFDEVEVNLGSGVTTDETGYIHVRSKQAFRRGDGAGMSMSSKGSGARFNTTADGGGLQVAYFRIKAKWTRIEDLEFTYSGTNTNSILPMISSGGDQIERIIVRGCTFYDCITTSISNFINYNCNSTANQDCPAIVSNLMYNCHNIAANTGYTFLTFAISSPSSAGTHTTSEIYHNVGYNLYQRSNMFAGRSWANADCAMKNNIMRNGSSPAATYLYQNLGGTFTTNKNTSNDATADDNGDGTHIISTDSDSWFVDAAGGNFHLVAGAGAIDFGEDLGTLLETNLDMDGDDRNALGVTWDTGIDEFTAPPDPLDWAEITRKRRLPATYRRHLIR